MNCIIKNVLYQFHTYRTYLLLEHLIKIWLKRLSKNLKIIFWKFEFHRILLWVIIIQVSNLETKLNDFHVWQLLIHPLIRPYEFYTIATLAVTIYIWWLIKISGCLRDKLCSWQLGSSILKLNYVCFLALKLNVNLTISVNVLDYF